MPNPSTRNTRFHYLYRDASNYKSWGSIVFAEEITDELNTRLSCALESGQFLIADQIRLPELFLVLPDWPLEQDDHCWHEFDVTESTTDAPDDIRGRTIHDFVIEVEQESRNGWRVFDPVSRQTSPQRPSFG
ncbi:MAG: hypothetical protein M3041_02645 [Acidobacteriota bacterium]|nr:hypothetical protein [Acidobacteriota bacterium]